VRRGIRNGERTPSHTSRRPRPSASRAEWRRRLALQTIENRVRLSEPVLGVLVSLLINPSSAGLEAVRRVEEHSNGMPRICWQTIFYLWEAIVVQQAAETARVTGTSRLSSPVPSPRMRRIATSRPRAITKEAPVKIQMQIARRSKQRRGVQREQGDARIQEPTLGQGNRIGPESVGILSFCENHSGNRSKPLKQLGFLSREAGVFPPNQRAGTAARHAAGQLLGRGIGNPDLRQEPGGIEVRQNPRRRSCPF
jgi:hypothetical protein